MHPLDFLPSIQLDFYKTSAAFIVENIQTLTEARGNHLRKIVNFRRFFNQLKRIVSTYS